MQKDEQIGIKTDWLRKQIYFHNQICQALLDCSKLWYIAGVDVAISIVISIAIETSGKKCLLQWNII